MCQHVKLVDSIHVTTQPIVQQFMLAIITIRLKASKTEFPSSQHKSIKQN